METCPLFVDGADTAQAIPDSSASVHHLSKSSNLGPTDPCAESTQLAIVTPEVGPNLNLQIRRIPVQPPKPGEVVVQIAWTGLCRSDACFSTGPEPGFPAHHHTAGHEGIGHVVQAHDPSLLGRPVATRYLTSTCNTCTYCLRGVPESCPDQTNFPKHHSGAFKQFVTAPWGALLPLPQWVFDGAGPGAYAYAAALCSGSTALKALRRAGVRPGDVVVIVGVAGAIGHLAGMMARRVFGAKVVGVDWGWKGKTEELARVGAFDVFVPAAAREGEEGGSTEEVKRRVREACAEMRGSTVAGVGLADAVVVAASSTAAYDSVTSYVCDGGSITCVGATLGNGQISVSIKEVVERQLKIQGNLMGGAEETYQVMEYIRQGIVTPLITDIGLEDIPEYMQKLTDCKTISKTVAKVCG